MNTDDYAYDPTNPMHLRERADAYEALKRGDPLEFLDDYRGWCLREPACQSYPLRAEFRYRPAPLAFPPLPEGEEWHNPDGLTPAQVGAGYRLLTKREREHRDLHFNGECDVDMWHRNKEWSKESSTRNCHATYRIPRSVPIMQPEPWQLTDHIPGFRALLPGERWHREDWTREMLPEGWRPLLEGETPIPGSDQMLYDEGFRDRSYYACEASSNHDHTRTRRPLPEPAPVLWSKREHVPRPLCWLRSIAGSKLNSNPDSMHAMIVTVSGSGISYIDGTGTAFISWSDANKLAKLEHSTDRQTWAPCVVQP